MLLTDKVCKLVVPAPKPYKNTDGQGLYLEVMPSGNKYWRPKYRFAGKKKRLALGVYPEISLIEARSKKESVCKLLASGVDPALARKEQKEAIALNAAIFTDQESTNLIYRWVQVAWAIFSQVAAQEADGSLSSLYPKMKA